MTPGLSGPAVAQVADEDQAAAVRMAAVGVVAQVRQQREQRVEFAVDVAHHVERAFGQRGEHGRAGHGASFADARRHGSASACGSFRISSISASTSTGLTKWWSKPASRDLRRSSLWPQPLSAISQRRSPPGMLADRARRLEAAHARHADVQQHDGGPPVRRHLHGLDAVVRDGHRIAEDPHHLRQALGASRRCRRRPARAGRRSPRAASSWPASSRGARAGTRISGSRTTKRQPRSGPSLVACTAPPCISTSRLTSARPMPRPPCARSIERSTCANMSNTRGSMSGVRPMPESCTVITASSPSRQNEHLHGETGIVHAAGEVSRFERERDGPQQVLVRHRAGERPDPLPILLGNVGRASRRDDQETAQKDRQLLQDVARIRAALDEAVEVGDGGGPVPRGDCRVRALEEVPVDEAEDLDALRLVDLASRDRGGLVEQRQGVPEASLRRRREQPQRSRGRRDLLRLRDLLELRGDLLDGQRAEGEPLAARDDRRRDLVELGRGEDELGVLRRLLERLEQRVEGLVGQHVNFVDDRDAKPVALRRVADRLDELPGMLDLAVRGAVHLEDVERIAALEDLPAGGADPAGLHGRPLLAIERPREHPRRGGLADAARARQEVRGGDAALGDRIRQGPGDGLLADEVVEGARPPFSGKRDVHTEPSSRIPAAEDEFRLTCGARGRLLIAASFRT